MDVTARDLDPPRGFERLVLAEAPEAGLRALICLHSTVLGPAAGGCRMWPYASDAEAIADVTRLAAGMTSKNAMAGLGLGGGKAVIIGDARRDKSPAMMRAFGRAVETLGGLYYTAEDVGVSPDDMALAAQETRYAVGLSQGSGDPSPWTAEGVFRCLRVGARHVFGSDDLAGRRVLVQGLGHVGLSLAEKLHRAGADLIVTDIHAPALADAGKRLGARICAAGAVFDQPAEILAPCALGGVLTPDAADRLQARLICGAANNQLATPGIAARLHRRGIVYLPDYVVNAGGIISVASEIHGQDDAWRQSRLEAIAGRMQTLLQRAEAEDRTTTDLADDMVRAILAGREVV